MTVTELPGGNPLQTYEELLRDRPGHDVFLFESPAGPVQDRRWAAVGWDRLAEIRLYAGRVELTAGAALGDLLAETVSAEAGPPKEAYDGIRVWDASAPETRWRLLAAITEAFDVDTDLGQDTFAFGFLTVLSYEAAWDIEDIPQTQQDADMPRCTLALFRNTVWYDQHSGGVRLLSASGPHFPAAGSEQALTPAAASGESEPSIIPAAPAPRSVTDNVEQETFTGRVERCLRHIGVGDSYQIQIGHRIDVETDLTPVEVYKRLRHRNPSPYMYLTPWSGRTVIGASPELFFRIEGRRILMRPIAGTAPRAADPAEDERRVAELRASAKEQAEHVMLVDLCRNDIGRVCVPGTLQVETMMEVEPFAYVHHLVSTVSGDLEDGVGVWEAVRATFPAGTMTGAPKVRAMEIINEIEDDPRGAYAGALGLIDVRGFAVLALCIRTTVHDGRAYSTQASAGVVADSVPASEWRETLAKMSATYWALTGEELLS
ncbi:anthranilate synthase component I family protein [Catenulispora acidiphila]|uniref:anthranilate synthase component I family protein n=1 Tax=Catenulispora acidiphila TaxID=304895 RepID=UPI001CBD506C|nr:anthranilate synthase component I family protein [Catenulispora acidiphila]